MRELHSDGLAARLSSSPQCDQPMDQQQDRTSCHAQALALIELVLE